MFLDGEAVLHITDTNTRFLDAIPLDLCGAKYQNFVKGIWLVFVMNWCTIFTGYHLELVADQVSAFTSEHGKQLAGMSSEQV